MYMLFFCKRKIIFEKDSGGIFAKYLGKRLTFQRDLIVNLKIRNFKGVPRFITVLHSIKSVNVTVNVTNAPSVNHTQQNLNESKSHSGK